jgi:hypothetical protein
MNPLLQTVNRKNAGNRDPDWVGDLMGYRLWVIGHRGHRPRPLLRPRGDDRIHLRRAARWAGTQPARPTTSASAAAAAENDRIARANAKETRIKKSRRCVDWPTM